MGKTKFDRNWMTLVDPNGQLFSDYIIYDEENQSTLFKVYCRICNRKKITFDNRGISALKDHARSAKHKGLANINSMPQQLRLKATREASVKQNEPGTKPANEANTIRLYATNEQILEKELIWTIHAVLKNESFNSAGKDDKILRLIAPNDLKGFNLNRQKMTHFVNEAIGPYFKDLFLNDVKGKYFSLLFDECEASNKLKELGILIKYHSPKLERLISFHLESKFIGKATAEVLLLHVNDALRNNNMSTDFLVMVGHDGPNVNKSFSRKLNNELIRERGYGLIYNNSCIIHTIHNAFRYSVKKFGYDVSDLAKYLFYYFKVPAKWENFHKNCNKKPKRFQKHIETRWASLGAAASTILANFDQLKQLKLNIQKMNKHSFYEKEILKLLTLPDIKEQIMFIIEITQEAESLIKFLETNDFILFDVYDKINKFIAMFLTRFYDPEKIAIALDEKRLQEDDLLSDEDVIIYKSVCDGAGNTVQWPTFKQRVKKHYFTFVNYLFEKKILCNFLKLVSFMKPQKIKDGQSFQQLVELAELVNFHLDKTKIYEEVVLASVFFSGQNFDCMLSDLEFYKLLFQQSCCQELQKLFDICSCVSHSNAEIERRFSHSKILMSDGRSRLGENTFNNAKNIINGMLFFDNMVTNFVCDKNLILKAKFARQAYEAKMDKKRNEEENAQRKQDEEEKKDIQSKIRQQEKALSQKAKAKQEAMNLIEREIKKIKSDHPDVAYLKILLSEKEKLAEQEDIEAKKLVSLKSV
ncbi:uncharacterized protein LOC131430760 [Malaya genurostris]|uniref:uncharacterized protein LOC131430760 n=1 Tax=Malaya genurostris TaxID=325434 RepID=UPI0026F3B1A1|nr:uncharacterized protein LOC131430760 [Malaya genurostris]